MNLFLTTCSVFRSTLNAIPESQSLLQKSRLPLGLIIHPFRDLSVSMLSKDWVAELQGQEGGIGGYPTPSPFYVNLKLEGTSLKCSLK